MDNVSAGIRRIAITTGGGDAPGLNAVIRAAVLSACRRGWQVIGIKRGYTGLFDHTQTTMLTRASVRGITHLGGTVIGTSSKGSPFTRYEKTSDGETRTIDLTPQALEGWRELGADALIAIGGDGSLQLAHHLHLNGVPVVGVPKTIDNDLDGTVVTFGFDTAVTVATEAIDRLHSTAEAHDRIFTVEVMGRYAGWIALHAGLAGTADVILIPEIPYELDSIVRKIKERENQGSRFAIVVVAEGAKPRGGDLAVVEHARAGGNDRLGGAAERLAVDLAAATGKETRSLVLGHIQRGGMPTARDRILSQRFGAAAVRAIADGEFGTMVALDPPDVRTVPLTDAIARMKTVPLDGDTVRSIRDMGICLGD